MKVAISLSLLLLCLTAINTAANGNVVRYYRFETNNGVSVSNGETMTVADDSSGNGLNGTVFGSPTYTTTPFPNPVPQTGASNQYAMLCGTGKGVLLSGATVPILAPTFTVEAYFDLTSTNPNTGDVKPIIRVEDPTTGEGVFTLEFLNARGSNGNGTDDLLLEMSNDGLELYDFDLQADADYFVAATCDGTNVNLYVDGDLIDSGSISGFTGSGTIGAAIGNDVPGNAAFQGYIDEVRISNTALSPSQFLDAVPEPASFPMLVLCGVALHCRRNRNCRVDTAKIKRKVRCGLAIFTSLAALILLVAPPIAPADPLLYAVNAGAGTISAVATDGTVSTLASGLDYPEGVTVGNFGDLYVANWGDSTISEITPGGSVSTFATGLDNPHNLVFDPSTGNLYVCSDLDNGSILKVTPSGSVSTFITSNYPHWLATDSSGNLYETNEGMSTINKITPSGNISTFATGFDVPDGLAFDSAGDLFVANNGNGTISEVTSGGSVSTFADSLNGAGTLCFDSYGNLYVAEGAAIDKFDSDGTSTVFATDPYGTPFNMVAVPEPASISLLALGGLVLFGRGRRQGMPRR
jgi:sugar lactone lactonase YvrE